MKTFNFFVILSIFTVFSSCDVNDDTPEPDAKNVSITGIEIISMPLTDNGSSWDLDGDADVIFKISNVNTVLFESNPPVNNVSNQDLPLSLQLSNSYQLPILNQTYSILLYDNDQTSGNDYIGGISFNPNNYKSEKPASKTFATADVQIKVGFEWE